MGKLEYDFILNGNIAIQTNRPIDNRFVVEYKSDLTDIDNWENFYYKGMVVAVISDMDSYNNGLYVYMGENDDEEIVNIDKWLRIDKPSVYWEGE